jgi:hypothetical protein
MNESYRALCSDMYVNQKLGLKLELPRDRQTVLELFDRVRRFCPAMNQFRRYRDELALETPASDPRQQWVAIRASSVRSGCVNADSLDDAYSIHRIILELCPYFLGIPPLDMDYLEILFGFDIAAPGNHNEVVYNALIAGSPLAHLMDIPGTTPIDCQPVFGIALNDPQQIEAHFEVKTRSSPRAPRSPDAPSEPISVYLTLRKYGPVGDIKDLANVLDSLTDRGEELVESRVVPNIIQPIRDAIGMAG